MRKIKSCLLLSTVIAIGALNAASSSSAGCSSKQAIVIDNGSGTIKAGFASTETPQHTITTAVVRSNKDRNYHYVGEEALIKGGTYPVKYPIIGGIITNSDDMEKIWRYTIEKALKVNPGDHPVLLTEHPLNPSDKREKTAQVMFEELTVPAMYLGNKATLALYAAGRTTGIVVKSGSEATSVVPIYEGHALSYAASSVLLGGNDIRYYLYMKMQKNGYVVDDSSKMIAVKDILQSRCFVAMRTDKRFDPYLDYTHMNTPIDEYKLPDGSVITLGTGLHQAPEVFFQPSLIGRRDYPGIHQLTYDAIMKVDPDLRADMFGNIVLSGGNTMFPGLGERLLKEIRMLAPAGTAVQVIAPQNRKYSAYIGGSILASLSTFQGMCISKAEYDAYGPTIVHRKFF